MIPLVIGILLGALFGVMAGLAIGSFVLGGVREEIFARVMVISVIAGLALGAGVGGAFIRFPKDPVGDHLRTEHYHVVGYSYPDEVTYDAAKKPFSQRGYNDAHDGYVDFNVKVGAQTCRVRAGLWIYSGDRYPDPVPGSAEWVGACAGKVTVNPNGYITVYKQP